jgi:hypothetical protein
VPVSRLAPGLPSRFVPVLILVPELVIWFVLSR